MFYSQYVLTKKGPLAKIWLAAHMQTKITKAVVFSTNIQSAVNSIISPDVPMALRLTSNLLLGVVRILARKTKYLLQDSSEAMARLKLTFRQRASTDLPDNTAALTTITLPNIDTIEPPNIDLGMVPSRTRPVPSSAFLAADQDITIEQFAGGLMGGIIDAFALEPQLPRDAELDVDLDPEPLLFTPSQRQQGTPVTPSVRSEPSVELLRAANDEPEVVPMQLSVERPRSNSEQSPLDPQLDIGAPQPSSAPPSPLIPHPTQTEIPLPESDQRPLVPSPPRSPQLPRLSIGGDPLLLEDETTPVPPASRDEQPEPYPPTAEAQVPEAPETTSPPLHTTQVDPPGSPVMIGEEDRDIATPTPIEGTPRRGRKRKTHVITDERGTEISPAAFRAALNDTSDLLRKPVQRRRVTASRSTQFQELISRPTVPLAPELMELFEANFRADELLVASPISDADIGDKRDDHAEEREIIVEKEPEQQAKEVIEDPTFLQLPEVAVDDTLRPDDEVPFPSSIPGARDTLTPVIPPEEEEIGPGISPQRFSLGPESVRVSVSMSGAAEDRPLTLLVVSDTAAQVQVEESVTETTISARTRKMQDVIAARLVDGAFDFTEAIHEVGGRRTASRCFYELLNLGNKKALQLRQDHPYGRICAIPIQPAFDSLREVGL